MGVVLGETFLSAEDGTTAQFVILISPFNSFTLLHKMGFRSCSWDYCQTFHIALYDQEESRICECFVENSNFGR
jgi:hypothetical protein